MREKNNFRTWKSGKKWLYSVTALAALAGGALVSPTLVSPQIVAKADTTGAIVIGGEDYASNFTANGNASISGDTATLTNNGTNQAGSTTLNEKIDFNQSFILSGSVNLGDKTSAQSGADGVSFFFQPGDTGTVGASGNGMGIGGIQGAFGFKLDTYYNETAQSFRYATADPSQFGPTNAGKAFGAFISTDSTGTVDTDASTAQEIPAPANNQFLPITISYDGSSHIMTVNYNGQVFTEDLSSYGTQSSYSFGIIGSTGASYNLQQFQLTNFTYVMGQGTATAHYVDAQTGQQLTDANGNPLAAAADTSTTGNIATAELPGDSYSFSQKDFSSDGYVFKEVEGNPTGPYTANANNVTFVYDHGTTTITPQNPQTPGSPINPNNPNGVKYPAGTDAASLTKTVNETVHYQYADGSQAAPDATQSLTFDHSITVDNVTGQIIADNGWTPATSDFSEKVSPTISGYTADKKSVAAVTGLTQSSSDIVETVTYSPVTTSYMDGNGNTLVPTVTGDQPSQDIPGYQKNPTKTTDDNGNTVWTYTPVTTSFVDGDGKTLVPQETGDQPSQDIPGYQTNPTKTTDDNGNTVWTYNQVTTSFVDGDGNPLKPTVTGDQPSQDIPGYQTPTKSTDSNGNTVWTYTPTPTPTPSTSTSYVDNNGKTLKPTVDGDQPAIDIPGYQSPTKSTDPNGNTVWTYTPSTTPNTSTTTSYVDNNGKTLKPTVDGDQPAIDIPGYQTPTKSTDSNGNTVWTYTPIPTPGTSTITSFVDGDGKTLKPSVDGNQPATDIPGYQKNPTKTTDKDGNTVWTYKKITTSFVDGDGNPIAPQVEGEQPSEKITGYELVNKTTDANGNIVYHYKALVSPTTTATSAATTTAQPSNPGSSFQLIATAKSSLTRAFKMTPRLCLPACSS